MLRACYHAHHVTCEPADAEGVPYRYTSRDVVSISIEPPRDDTGLMLLQDGISAEGEVLLEQVRKGGRSGSSISAEGEVLLEQLINGIGVGG